MHIHTYTFAAINNYTEVSLAYYKERAVQYSGDIFFHAPLLLGTHTLPLKNKIIIPIKNSSDINIFLEMR